jgi:chromosome segregation ATPase
MENIRIINWENIKNLNEQIKELNFEKNPFVNILNRIEYKKIEPYILNDEFNLTLNNLREESHNSYLKLETINKELNQLNDEIIVIRRDIEIFENNCTDLNDKCTNYDFNLNKLEKQKQNLYENLKKIRKIVFDKLKEYNIIRNQISSIREGLKEEKLKANLEVGSIISTESSKIFTLELELTHLKREENFYFKKIEDIDRIIKLNSINNSNIQYNPSEIKHKLILLQEKLVEKEKLLKKHEITRIHLENLMDQIKQEL